MRIIRHYRDCPEFAKNAVIALGNFDGVHLGHKQVISKAIDIAKSKNLSSAVLTFEPHPASVLFPNDARNIRITPFRNKAELLTELGIDIIFSLRFDKNFSLISADDFIKSILADSLAAKHLVVGHDFVFGHKKSGNVELLKKMSGSYGYEVTQLKAIGSSQSQIYSSTAIRNLIREGKIKDAEKILGHDYFIEGKVIKGHGRASKIGFKTANIRLDDHLRPAFGVYIAETLIEKTNKALPSIINIGKRPTFGDNEDILETHIFDFEENIYGKRICVRPLEYLRPEKKFSGIEELTKQIKEDCEQARKYFAAK